MSLSRLLLSFRHQQSRASHSRVAGYWLESLEPRRLLSTTYFVSPLGSDTNSGTSSSSPWKTISKVNNSSIHAGDTIRFQGGATFSGSLALTSAHEPGTSASPITLSSYGTGRTTIASGSSNGVTGSDVGGIVLNSLNFIGSGGASNTADGIKFSSSLRKGQLNFVRVDQVDVSGYGDRGIYFTVTAKGHGFNDVRITNATVHDNVTAGIEIGGVYQSGSVGAYSNSGIYLGHDTVWNTVGKAGTKTHSGDGILVWDTNGLTIERSVAHDNGINNTSHGGPVGIWCWQTNNATIQYNESYHNLTHAGAGGGDGGGFDLDGGTTNSVMQYNYSHDNAGAGFLVYEFSGAAPLHDNTVRYNITQNDARSNNAGIITGGGVSSIHIYNNTVFVSPGSGPAIDISASLSDVRDNIFMSTGGVQLVRGAGATFQDNDYWTSAGYSLNLAGYSSLAAWQQATGQETLNGQSTGFNVDPQLNNAGGGGTIGNADNLYTLTAYQLAAGSPMINAGLTLTQFGLNPGNNDFFGNPIPDAIRGLFDIGADEAT